MSLTEAQCRAVQAEGNVLLVAGAGTGKTRTLVARCLRRLLDPNDPTEVQDMLIVTFTEAAAAEVRERLSQQMEQQPSDDTTRGFLKQQRFLLDSAHIGTLHSFCFELVRQNFYDLGLSPRLRVLSEPESKELAGEVLEALLAQQYSLATEKGRAVRRVVSDYFRGRDEPLRHLVLSLHHYAQTLANRDRWFSVHRSIARCPASTQWEIWWNSGWETWAPAWRSQLAALARDNPVAAACASAFEALDRPPAGSTAKDPAGSLGRFEGRKQCLERILEADRAWPKGQKTVLRRPMANLFDEAGFLHALTGADGGLQPLHEDWQWARPTLATILELAALFQEQFLEAKSGLGVLDFHDLEQYALRLLVDAETGAPTPLARDWQRRFKQVLVDEYQDINAAQDAILTAVSRQGDAANRFLVGDVKQSVYGFRLANPKIFQNYERRWRGPEQDARVIDLNENFRSRQELLEVMNLFFSTYMTETLGGVPYQAGSRLSAGRDARRAWPQANPKAPPCEIHFCLKPMVSDRDAREAADGSPSPEERSQAEKEALVVGRRLRNLFAAREPIVDPETGRARPLQWTDIAILVRSARKHRAVYARVFQQLGIPLIAPRDTFFDAPAVKDLIQLIRILDNPRQNIPLIAVLRSPVVGLEANQLAMVRLIQRDADFWTALNTFCARGGPHGEAIHAALGLPEDLADSCQEAWEITARFLESYRRWRRSTRFFPLHRQLETILDETRYLERTASDTADAQQHVNYLLEWAGEFDRKHAGNLHRFLRHFQAAQESDPDLELPHPREGKGIRLMTIHRSKGLEFPIVVIADLGDRFNLKDVSDALLVDEDYGPCLSVHPPGRHRSYPSLPLWLARQRKQKERLSEEMRLLYVAFTRARERLILVGSASRSAMESKWPLPLDSAALPQASSYLDWIGPWCSHLSGKPSLWEAPEGSSQGISWRLYDDAALVSAAPSPPPQSHEKPKNIDRDEIDFELIEKRLGRPYPFEAANHITSKSSVTGLLNSARPAETEADGDAGAETGTPVPSAEGDLASRDLGARSIGAASLGLIHHRFLQHVHLAKTSTPAGLKDELHRMRSAGILTPQEASWVQLPAMDQFWNAALGQKIRQHQARVQRELPFTCRLPPRELADAGMLEPPPLAVNDSEWIVLQGVVDLAVIHPDAIWIVDYKTDDLRPGEETARARHHAPQIQLYRTALERIYRRPVTEAYLHFLRIGRSVALV